jgi:hypothetical protein
MLIITATAPPTGRPADVPITRPIPLLATVPGARIDLHQGTTHA